MRHAWLVVVLAGSVMIGGCGDDDASCADDLIDCGGSCIDVSNSVANCGECGTVCGTGELCVDGVCAVVCPSGLDECGGTCVDYDVDPANCGDCGTDCAAGEYCSAGQCAGTCPTDTPTVCGNACVDTDTNPAYCGDCNTACAAGEACNAGVCELSCGSMTECGNACVDTDTNPAYCGDCNTACTAGEVCNAGVCGQSCGSLTECSGACVDTDTNPAFCGDCATACAGGTNALGTCVAGGCRLICEATHGDCNFDLTDAAGDGCETDVTGDVDNCGACGAICDNTNTTPICAAGACETGTCDGGFDDCNADPTDGCEVDTTSDATHCGDCTTACGSGELCVSGTCLPLTGDDCSNPIALTQGANSVAWNATAADYFTTASCTTYDLVGPDVVLSYTATADGLLDVTLTKPASLRFAMMITDTCGSTTELDCSSEFTSTTMTVSVPMVAGQTYYVYVSDTDSSTDLLPNPLDITVSERVQTCTPGTGGIVGANLTVLAGGPVSGSEYYVGADNSATGWVYVGGTGELLRQPKAGGATEDVEALAGLTAAHLGYAMMFDGNDVYTINSTTTGTAGIVWRISDDGGATWLTPPLDYVTFPSTPGDDIRGAAAYGGNLYFVTEEYLSGMTEIWSAPGSQATAVTATLEATFTGYSYCNSIALDANYYYIGCSTDEILRIDRTTNAISQIGTFLWSSTSGQLYAHDHNTDGVADALYLQSYHEEVFYICDPTTAAPWNGVLVNWGAGTSNYGLGFDSVSNVLWSWDDDTEEFLHIQ